MKYRIVPFFIFILFTAFFSSCGGPDFSPEIRSIDSLRVEIDRIEKELGTLDSAILDTISMHASNNVNILKKVYDTDTIDMVRARKITTYKSLRRVNLRANKQRAELWAEIHLSEKQLENLKKSLEHGDFELEVGRKYFQEEKLATRALFSAYEAYKGSYESTRQLYDSLNPYVLEVIRGQ